MYREADISRERGRKAGDVVT